MTTPLLGFVGATVIGRLGDAALLGAMALGAVIFDADGTELATGANEREATGDPTAHAEVLALRRAAAAIAKDANKTGSTLREAALRSGKLTEEEFDAWVVPMDMTHPSAG